MNEAAGSGSKSVVFPNLPRAYKFPTASILKEPIMHSPAPVSGNIFSISGNEKVLGYFDAASASLNRSFFVAKDFEASGYTPPQFLQSCLETDPVEIPIEKLGATMEVYQKSLAIYDALGAGPSSVLLLRISCCDCTSKGTTVRPTFWE